MQALFVAGVVVVLLGLSLIPLEGPGPGILVGILGVLLMAIAVFRRPPRPLPVSA